MQVKNRHGANRVGSGMPLDAIEAPVAASITYQVRAGVILGIMQK